MPSTLAPVPADLQALFARISPIRHGSVLRYPRLVAHILWNRRIFHKVQPGGTLIVDDDYLDGFGERQAVDELRASLGDTTPLLRVGQSAVWRLPG